jgi:uncharacterized protein (UPF0254 family)
MATLSILAFALAADFLTGDVGFGTTAGGGGGRSSLDVSATSVAACMDVESDVAIAAESLFSV